MIKYIDGYYVAAQVRLLRQMHKGAVVLLEGETDAKVVDRFFDSSAVETEVSFGKANALQALDLLEDEGFPGVLAIVDADFDRIEGVDRRLENLFLSDCHDIDLMLFGSEALDAYLREHAEERLFSDNFKSNVNSVRERIFSATSPVAHCRLVNHCKGWRLDFKSLRLYEFVDVSTLEVDVDKLFGTLLRPQPAPCTLEELKKLVTQECRNAWDVWQLSHGHDVCAVLGVALRQCLALRKFAQTWGSEIEAGLRLAYSSDAFAKTALFADLKVWEEQNPKYRLFG